MRTPIIAGNWKMHKTMKETNDFINKVKDFELDGVEAVLCVPYTDLIVLNQNLGNNIKIGAQNIHWEEKGAFTGEISPLMLKELNVKYTIIGHSERRDIFGETDETVHKKVHTAIKHGINPIICVGEHLEDRERGNTKEIVKNQVEKSLAGFKQTEVKDMVIAYEPIWAIGTGKSSTAEDANEVIGFIRSTITSLFDKDTANAVRIQYGGSVKPENISLFMEQPEIDGALVGGASLEPESFKALVYAARKNGE